MEEVRTSGMQGEEVKALLDHAEGIVKRHQVEVDSMMGGDETMGFLFR